MAAPPNVTTKAMGGRFIMNKALSSDADDILRLQGVSWFKRRAISMFTLNLRVKHYTDDDGVEHIDIDQTLSGASITGTSENRALDCHERDEYDDVFGLVTEKSRRIPVEEITDEFLKKDWTQDTIDDDIIFIDSWSAPGKNSYTWRAVQTWGFSMVNGERRHVRHVTFTSPQKQDGPIHARLVYDYITPN
ncbi:hypothetical protein EV363DRAFT_345131 [Boletus edulis]|uniref:Uncharacterized protein n=1 Tax=Boletus edulis BED1 TaxID=1328754 RepID=A0AAD4C2F7_BOLED|nr:hypothetical protein EV363DRAFT_345131 [Boletus edulis]KAF8445805.1 hypothetical protein L210DRAFT_975814 [Boletus edulis BED1]